MIMVCLSIKFRYATVWGPMSGYDGTEQDYVETLLKPGEYIVDIEIWYGSILDIVTFYSQNGNYFSFQRSLAYKK